MLSKYFADFSFFFGHLRYRIFLMMAFNIGVAVLDGLGLSMFLPLLQLVSGDKNVDPSALGNLKFVVEFLNVAGIPLTLTGILLFMTGFFVLKGVAVFVQGTYETHLQQFFVRNIRLENIKRLNSISFKRFVLADIGQIQNTLSGEVDRVSRAFGSFFLALQQMILVAVYMNFAFLVDIQFAVLVCAGGVITNFLFKAIYRRTKLLSKKLTNYTNYFQGLIIQYVGNFKYLKATGTLSKYSAKLTEEVYKIESSNKRIGVLSSIVKGAREPLIILVVSTVILVQTALLGSELAPILVSLLFFYRALTSLMAMQTAWNYFLGTSGSLANMSEFSSTLEKGREKEGAITINKLQQAIELKKASFSYVDRPVLKDISLRIRKNETIAFVGGSGSGKTTLVSILAGLMPLDSGEMLIDGIERGTANISTFQGRVGYITQDPVIFSDTIFNNVTLWAERSETTLKRFHESMRNASLFDFLNSLPEREETTLGNNGINLSGGQKQRISIARELFKDIDILILDEATSALDSETERAIQSNVDQLKGKYTVLIVAHRLSTVRNADRIVFMQDGKAKHIGTFDEIIECVPDFQRMVEFQTL
jgi:ABC-type multidrug transport system fused ATPase/permease subunit